MIYSNGKFEIICNYLNKDADGCNETNEELAKHRAECGEQGYDASVEFQVFINDKCINFIFNLFGLDVYHTFSIPDTEESRKQIYDTIELVNKWFKDKSLNDISEKMYHEIEKELGSQIYERIIKR